MPRRPPAAPPAPVVARVVARVVVGAAAGVVVALAALTAVPGALGLAAATPMAQLVPFRAALALLLLAAAGALLGARSLVRWSVGRRGRRRPPLRAAGAAAVGLVLVAAVHVAVVGVRGTSPAPAVPRQDGDLVVLSLNTLHGAAGAAQVADAVERSGADVVALPETPADVVGRLARPFRALTGTAGPDPTAATTLLVAEDLGPVAPAEAPEVGLGAAAARVPGLPGPLVAVHAVAPVPRTGLVPQWREDVPRVAAACADAPGAVVAGDVNATLDHPGLLDLGPCVDAATRAGAGGLGTWPATTPALLAAPIDHVLVDDRAWRVLSVQLVTVGSTDHRGLVVHLARRD